MMVHVDARAGLQVLESLENALTLTVACVPDTLWCVFLFCPALEVVGGGVCLHYAEIKWTARAKHGWSDRSFSVRAAPT